MLLDTSAWIEFFEGTAKGAKVRELIRGKAAYASILTIAELRLWGLKNSRKLDAYTDSMEQNATVLDIDKKTAELAAYTKFKYDRTGIRLIDCLIYATALTHDMQVISTDAHFRSLENTIFVDGSA